jgi:hypothetical protein
MKRALFTIAFVLAITGVGSVGAQTTFVSNLKLDLGNSSAKINTMVRQADGKIIIGGDFLMVDNVPRSRLARLNADGSLDTNWNPNANGEIRRVVVSGTNIYACGWFTSIGGQSRRYIARLDDITGAVDPAWNPNPAGLGGIYTLLVSGTNLYIGGDFTNICGLGRNRLVRLDEASGVLDTNWNPNANASVYVIAVSGTNIFAGGLFTSIGGRLQNKLARLNDTNGAAYDWNTNIISGSVLAILPSGTNLYVGGDSFIYIGNQNCTNIVKLGAADCVANTNWNPQVGSIGAVRTILLNGANVYIGGSFLSVGGQSIPYLAKVNDTSGALDASWNPAASWYVNALLASGAWLYVGGEFSSICGETARAFARLEISNLQRDPAWARNCYLRGKANCFGFQPDGKVIAGGVFIAANGEARTNLARLNPDGTLDANWKPDPNGEVSTILVDGTNLYIGGWFNIIGGSNRSCFAKLNYDNGSLDAGWTNVSDGPMLALKLSGEHIYAGGWFTSMGGQSRTNAAKFRRSDGALDPTWLPAPDDRVESIALDGTNVYLAGMFYNVGGQVRKYVAKLNTTDGAADPLWNAGTERRVYCIAATNNYLYAGGEITNIGGFNRNQIARLNTSNGDADPAWNPSASSYVDAIVPSDAGIYASGGFTNIGGQTRSLLARLDATTGAADPAWNFELSGNRPVDGLAFNGRFLWVGGYFYEAGGLPRVGVAAIETAYPPAIGSPASSGIGANSANLGGAITDTMGAVVSERGVYWSLASGFTPPGQGTKVSEAGAFGTGAFAVAVSGLTPGMTHYFKAFAVNALGTSYTEQASFQTLPETPGSLNASDGRYADKILLTWSAVSSAGGYQVWRHTTNDSAGASQIGTSAQTNYADPSAAGGQIYYYWAKATNAGGASAFSASDSGWRRSVGSSHYADVDIDGDRKADLVIFDPLTGAWRAKLSASGYAEVSGLFGGPDCTLVPGDYDGDRLTDPGTYTELAGLWQVMLSASGYAVASATLGGMGYAPTPGDFDGDRKTDLGVYEAVSGKWQVLLSASGYTGAETTFGGAEYLPVQRDYDGDLKYDPAIYHLVNGAWQVMLSGSSYGVATATGFGGTGYAPVVGDYDGDGKADPALYHEATGLWTVMLSGSGYLIAYGTLGGTGYAALPADYDGDGKTDPGVYNITTGEWIVMLSDSGYGIATAVFGGEGYDPVGLRPK